MWIKSYHMLYFLGEKKLLDAAAAVWLFENLWYPGKILLSFSCTAPLQYVPKIQFTQATTDRLTNNKTKNALHNETVILNYICCDPISHGLSN